MASRAKTAAKKLIDWVFLLSNNTPLPKKSVNEALAKHEELSRLVFEAHDAKPHIHWAYYQSHLRPADMAFIESCKASSEQFKTEALKQSDVNAAVEKESAQLMAEADAFLKANQEKSRHAKAKYESLMAMPPVDDMTVDDVYKVYPEWQEEFHDRLRRDFWCHNYSLADYEAAVKAWKARHHGSGAH